MSDKEILDNRTHHLVLASGSPRRREMLKRLGFTFEVRPANIDESPLLDEQPSAYVLRLAKSKARTVADAGSDSANDETVLAADTIVVYDGALLGQPKDEADARRMLTQLSGQEHQVLTGVAICNRERGLCVAAVETTVVHFAELSEHEVAWYAASGEPLDKAGAYAVQGLGAVFVERIEGNYSNVVGLPLPLTCRLLRRVGYPLPFDQVDDH